MAKPVMITNRTLFITLLFYYLEFVDLSKTRQMHFPADLPDRIRITVDTHLTSSGFVLKR